MQSTYWSTWQSCAGSGHLASLVKQHHGELRRGMVAFLRRQLQAAKPDPLRGSQVPSSTCADSPRSARSVASSRPGKSSHHHSLRLVTPVMDSGRPLEPPDIVHSHWQS